MLLVESKVSLSFLAIFLTLSSLSYSLKALETHEIKTWGQLEEFYGIEIQYDGNHSNKMSFGWVSSYRAREGEIERYQPILIQELTRHTTSFIKASQLKKIILCKNLRIGRSTFGGFSDISDKTLIIDVNSGIGDRRYQRKLIQHELFHLIDAYNQYLLQGKINWAALNEKDFKYGDGGMRFAKHRPASMFRNHKGFITQYSRSSPGEDRAELFGAMMVESSTVEALAINDEYLQKKVEALKIYMNLIQEDLANYLWPSP